MNLTRRKRKRSNLDLYLYQSELCLSLSSSQSHVYECYRRARVTIAEKEQIAQDTEEALRKELEAEERRQQSRDLVAESIRRELAESTCFLSQDYS